jgi:hypothetical protein
VEPPPAVQEFVSDELQVRENNSPVVAELSFEDNVSVGAGSNVTVVIALADPVPLQAIVYR